MTVTFALNWWMLVPVAWTALVGGAFYTEIFKEDMFALYLVVWFVGMVLMLAARLLP